LCKVTPREIDELRIPEFAALIDGIDAYIAEMSKDR
jgi:hypothetical protein